jgi:hypothetical protein
MNLYFQFLTQNQSADAIEMILLPALLWPAQPLGGSLKMSAEGVISRSKFSELEAVAAKRAKKRFKQLELIFDVKELQIGAVTARVSSFNGVFSPSPTCDLWLPTSKWSMAVDGTVGKRWMTAKNREDVLKYHGVSQQPSVFEMVWSIETPSPQAVVLNECASWLARTVPESLAKLQLFGCCDVGGPEYFVLIEANVIMTMRIRVMENVEPAARPELGKRFEALHPLMFGSQKACVPLVRALGKDARLISGSRVDDFAVVRLRDGCDLSEASQRVARLLLSQPAPSS